MFKLVLTAVFYDTDGIVRRYSSKDGMKELRHNQVTGKWDFYENGSYVNSSRYRLNLAMLHCFNLEQDFSTDATKTDLVLINPLINDGYNAQMDAFDEKVNI